MIKKIKPIITSFCLLASTFSFAQQPVLNFDGVNDYVALDDVVGDGLRTIELWFKPENDINNTNSNYQTLVAREFSGTNIEDFNLAFHPGGYLVFNIDENGVGSGFNIQSDANFWAAGVWHHVAVVVDPTDGMTMFIDGVEQIDTEPAHSTATIASTAVTVIGNWGDNSVMTLNRYFKGSVDDVRISSDAVYTTNFTPPCPDLQVTVNTLGLWNMNEGTGTTTAEESGFASDGVIYGAVWDTAEICPNCICDADIVLISSLEPNSSGELTAQLSINTNGLAVSSVCIDLPYFQLLTDPDCIDCDVLMIPKYGTIVGGQALSGVTGVLDDPFGIGAGRRICYTFSTPTVINETINLNLQFPGIVDPITCKNLIDYCLRVKLTDENCFSCESEACPKVINKNSVEKQDESQTQKSAGFELFPNPANSTVEIRLQEAGESGNKLSVYSNSGTLILNQDLQELNATIDISKLSAGTYFVTIETNGNKTTQILVKE